MKLYSGQAKRPFSDISEIKGQIKKLNLIGGHPPVVIDRPG